MKIKNLDKFKDKVKWTTVTEDGSVSISVGTKEFTGRIRYSNMYGYWVEIDYVPNHKPFDLAKVNKIGFTENILGYINSGGWPYMRSTDDILKVLVELDKLYTSKKSESEIEKPKPMETEHPSIANIDFTPKKKHYSFNFQI